MIKIMVIFALLLFLLISCGDDDDDDKSSSDDDAGADDDDADLVDPKASDDAYLPAGPMGDGTHILPNGRLISPVGQRITVQRFPMSMVLSPDSSWLYVATTKVAALSVINTLTAKLENQVDLSKHFGGMAINSDGTRLWVGGANREVVYEYILAEGTPVLNRQISAFGYPTDLQISADEQLMYVSLAYGKRVAVIDIDSGLEVGSFSSGYYPYDVAIAEPIDRGIVTNWGTSTVTVFDLSTNKVLADVPVGKNPEGVIIAPDGKSAYVACSDTDDIYKVDLQNLVTTQIIPLYDDDTGFGAFPTELALSPDGKTLYVVASGFNSIDVIDIEMGQVIGRIPTEWYPTRVLPLDDMLYVLSGKGTGSGAGNVKDQEPEALPEEGGKLLGSVEIIDIPNADLLSEYTDMVVRNNSRTSRFYEGDVIFDSPIPSVRGEKSDKIKHVVFIMKENKTFDQVMSDIPGVQGDKSLLIFGEHFTPNIHALAKEFALCDNYYSEAHESDMGHSWATGVVANDYVEKNWVASDWQILTGIEPGSIPSSGTVFDKMIKEGIDFRIYGEVTGTLVDLEKFSRYLDFNFGFYNLAVSDRIKAQETIREWEAGIFPEFIFILLPNDHGYGTDPGKPTLEYLIADNDAGTGMLVDWIVKSKYWKDTVVFITQDDPQSGVDHIDAHRTPFTVVSPYAKRGHISSVHYSMASMWLTIELILGMPPLTNYDRFTAPMYDLFQNEQNLETTFSTIPSNVQYAENPDDLPYASYCSRQDWSAPDRVELIGQVVWAYMKPGVPFPNHLSVAPSEREFEEEGEEKNENNYGKLMKAYIDYAKRNNLLIKGRSLVDKELHIK